MLMWMCAHFVVTVSSHRPSHMSHCTLTNTNPPTRPPTDTPTESAAQLGLALGGGLHRPTRGLRQQSARPCELAHHHIDQPVLLSCQRSEAHWLQCLVGSDQGLCDGSTALGLRKHRLETTFGERAGLPCGSIRRDHRRQGDVAGGKRRTPRMKALPR